MNSADQLQKLNRLLQALTPANRFYAEKLQRAGLTNGVASLEEFFLRMPLTTKAEIVSDQRAHPPYGSNLTYPVERYTRFTQTSGTTGTPLRWLDTPESWNWMLDCWAQVFSAAGANPGDRILFAFSFGPFLGFWTAFEAAARLGCLCLPAGGLSSLARLQMLRDNQVDHLCCTPTYALRLGLFAQQEQFDLSACGVRTIIVAGEPGGSVSATRARIETLWPGARVFDHHGMTEIGPVTYEASPGNLVVIEAGYIAEAINLSADGSGELVLTNLGRLGSPLVRYRTGDLVKPVRRDGRLLLAGGILGRVDDMVIIRGVNVYPTAIEQIVRACPHVSEYRVSVREVNELTELEIILEPTADCADARGIAARLEAELQAVLALRIPVRLAAVGSLPRPEMKSQRWCRASCAACDGAENAL
jgi:phenylacetate-CoA ligase